MAAKTLLAQSRGFSDNTKNAWKLSEKSRDLKIIRDKKVDSYLDDFTPTALAEENSERFVDSEKLASMAMSRRAGKYRNGKLETRYRTSSTDSAFSEESFVDLDSDESTKLESLIDQLIFTDDRLNSDKSTFVKPENLPPIDSNILDVGDLFNYTDIFTVDFESLNHDTYTPNFIEGGLRPDTESTESRSSISSSESGKGSIDKYPMKMSAFLESHVDRVLNHNYAFESERFTKSYSNAFTSSDEDELIECGGGVGKEKSASGSDCYNNDSVHENSFVDLSNLLDITSYGSSLYAEGNLPADPESRLKVDDDENMCTTESNNISADCRDTRGNDTVSLEADRSKIKMTDIGGITGKTSNERKDGETALQLTDAHSWLMPEIHKREVYKCGKGTDITHGNPDKMADKNRNEPSEYSQESLYLHSFENLCGYGDRVISGINQNKNVCHFRDYNDPQNMVTFKNSARTTHSVEDWRQILKSSEEIKSSNQKDIAVDVGDSKIFNGEKWLDVDEPDLPFATKNDTAVIGSEISKGVDFAHIDKVRFMATRMFPNEDYVKSVIAKDHSYRVQIPDSHKEINISKPGTKEKNNGINRFNNFHVKQIPVKRPLVNDLNPVGREFATSKEEKSPRRSCLLSYTEFPYLKSSIEENSVLIEPPLKKSANNNNNNNDSSNSKHSDNSGCLQRKIPKFSIFDPDKTDVQPAILYKILAMEHHSSPDSFSPPSCLPVTIQDHCDSQPPIEPSLKNHGLPHLRQEMAPTQKPSVQAKNEKSEMGELEKYLRGIIPTENCDRQEEVLVDHKQENSNLINRMGQPPYSFLKKLLTGEMTVQMYRQIDRQFYENELIIQNESTTE